MHQNRTVKYIHANTLLKESDHARQEGTYFEYSNEMAAYDLMNGAPFLWNGCAVLAEYALTAISIIVLVTVLGGFALGILFINHTELFMLSSKEIVVENKNLVQDFIDTQPTVSGKFVKVNRNVLTLEKNIHSSTDTRTIMDLEITPNSNIYICYNKINYFFSTISGEQISYEKIEYSDFLSQNSNSFTKENNVRIWSSDGKTIDNLVITEWIE